MKKFLIKKDKFVIDGKEIKLISGAMHYFRIFPEYWRDRLKKLKDMGCNCVETYIAWNLHEKEEGKFECEGMLDFSAYLNQAQREGLYAIVRPGPYICSECDFGGLPWWLLRYEGIELRTYNKIFLEKVEKYIGKVCDILRPHLIINGGNVVMIQIENEFGSFGDDKYYLNEIVGFYRKNGIDVPFITSDGDNAVMLSHGYVPGIYAAVNYRWDSVAAIRELKKFQPDKPGAVMELWNGSAIHCGKKVVPRDLTEVEYSVKTALENASLVNLYMFHGGTNFGFFNGSLYFDGKFTVQATSYDVQAPLNEYGGRTKKYYAEQKIICDYLGKKIVNTTADPVLVNYGEASLKSIRSIENIFSPETIRSEDLLSMEECGQGYGYIEYKTRFNSGKMGVMIEYPEIRDLAQVYIDDRYYATVRRGLSVRGDFPVGAGEHELRFFVENSGRIHYGPHLQDKKGLLGTAVLFDKENQTRQALRDWEIKCYPFSNISDTEKIKETEEITENNPYFYTYEIDIDPSGDTYLETPGFYRGVAFVNGFNLGRHTAEGPQKSLYVPKSLLKKGKNEIVIFEMRASLTERRAIFSGKQILDGYAE